MITVGLTGSIAMGKSTIAKMFASRGIPVFDSDAAVHQLYSPGGGAVKAIAELVPSAVVAGTVDRHRLTKAIENAPNLLEEVERTVHPLVRNLQKQFLVDAGSKGTELVVLDIPLLFETEQDEEVDKIIVVSAPFDIQRSRALARPGMTKEKFNFIVSKQMPDALKRLKADYVVDTSRGLEDSRRQIDDIIRTLIGT